VVRPREIIRRYNTDATIEGADKLRWYDLNGVPHPSVTTIIGATSNKYLLQKWKQRTPNHEEIGETARRRGDAFHYYTMKMLRPYGLNISHLEAPDPDTYDEDELSEMLDNTQRWIEVVNPKGIMICEWPLFHREAIFAGTFDIMMGFDVEKLWNNMVLDFSHFEFLDDELRDDDIWMIDLKSSKRIREEVQAQLAAYMLLCWVNGLRPNRMGVFQCNIETDWEFRELDFMAGLKLFQNHWIKFRERVMNID
jgi:hypothetical protein